MKKARFDVHQHVTDGILKAMEEGTPPWRKPWTGGAAMPTPTRSTGQFYRGINMIWLWCVAYKNEYSSDHWFTYKQAAELGGQVRKGEKSTRVIFYSSLEIEDEKAPQGDDPKIIPFTKSYAAFNADQIDNLPDDFYRQPDPVRDMGTEEDPYLEQCFAATGAELVISDRPKAYFSLPKDIIHMPPINTFHNANGYYLTLFHELVHWSGVKDRLDRDIANHYGEPKYAFEELVAELGACMICATLNVEPDFTQSASYIENWKECLKEDKKAIFKAAALAQKALDYVMDLIESDHGIELKKRA